MNYSYYLLLYKLRCVVLAGRMIRELQIHRWVITRTWVVGEMKFHLGVSWGVKRGQITWFGDKQDDRCVQFVNPMQYPFNNL